MVVGQAGRSNETGGVPMGVGHGSPAGTTGQLGDLVASKAVTAAQRGAEWADMIDEIVDEWGMQSFPASDPPSNW